MSTVGARIKKTGEIFLRLTERTTADSAVLEVPNVEENEFPMAAGGELGGVPAVISQLG